MSDSNSRWQASDLRSNNYRRHVNQGTNRHADHRLELQEVAHTMGRRHYAKESVDELSALLNGSCNIESRGAKANRHKGHLTSASIREGTSVNLEAYRTDKSNRQHAERLAQQAQTPGARHVLNNVARSLDRRTENFAQARNYGHNRNRD